MNPSQQHQHSSSGGSGGPPPPLNPAAKEAPIPYSFEPPRWRPPLHPKSEPSGVPDVYPTRPGQPEDDLSQNQVRTGFSQKSAVINETFSAHDMILPRLKSHHFLPQLGQWMDEALRRRQELQRSSIATWQRRVPCRVTLNDVKVANYVKDLADPDVPLHRLSRSVPHGFRGEKLFEMLSAGIANSTPSMMSGFSPRVGASPSTSGPRRSVEIQRAIWFIRAMGAAEIQSVRNKSSWTYTQEMTAHLCAWLGKQMQELNCISAAGDSTLVTGSPATPSPGFFQAKTPGSSGVQRQSSLARTPSAFFPAANGLNKDFCPVLQNEAEEERWISKWSYSLSLTRQLNAQQLLDRPTLFRWIIEALNAANLAQLWFTVQLTQEIINIIIQRHFLARPLIAAISTKLEQLDTHTNPPAVAEVRKRLEEMLRFVVQRSPESLISPRLWHEHHATIITTCVEHNSDGLLRRVQPRIDYISLNTASASNCRYSASSCIKALDSLDETSQGFTALLSSSDHDHNLPPISERAEAILTWACTAWRCGSYRQYTAASLIEKIKLGRVTFNDSDGISNGTRRKKRPRLAIEPILLKWLTDVETAMNAVYKGRSQQGRTAALASVEFRSVIVLFSELARRGLFSYSKYLQHLIARGMTTQSSGSSASAGTDANGENSATSPTSMQPPTDSLHLRLLRSLPLYQETPDVLQQRRMAIYGERKKETWEEAVERRALRELRHALPWLFEGGDGDQQEPAQVQQSTGLQDDQAIRAALPHLWTASRYIRIKIFRTELLPRAATRPSAVDSQRFCSLATAMMLGEDYESLLQLIVSLLMRPLEDGFVQPLYDLVVEHHEIWRGLDALPTLIQLVRQQLNHASSMRQAKLAVSSSNTLQRLRRLQATSSGQEPEEVHSVAPADPAPAVEIDPAEQQRCQKVFRKLGFRDDAAQGASAFGLADLRQLFTRSDASVDETIETAIAECLLEPGADQLVEPAHHLLRQLHSEASTEIDDRHARWLSALSAKLANEATPPSLLESPLRLVTSLLVDGIASLPVVIKHLLLPMVTQFSKCLVDPANRKVEAIPLLLRCADLLSTVLLFDDVQSSLSLAQKQSLRAQRAILFSPSAFDGLVRLTTLFVITAANGWSPPAEGIEEAAEEAQDPTVPLQTFTNKLLGSDNLRSAFFRNPRTVFHAIRETAKGVWGCTPREVLDKMMQSLDPSSLLLQDLATIDGEAVRLRGDPWHTSVLTCELVNLFERLEAAESSLQAHADSRIKGLVAGLYQDFFLKDPQLGIELLQDSQSPALGAKFLDVGLKMLLEATKGAAVETGANKPDGNDADAMFKSVKVIMDVQSSFAFSASDSETTTQLFQLVTTDMEAAAAMLDLSKAQAKFCPKLGLLYILLRFNCLWTNYVKALVGRLLTALLQLCQLFGIRPDMEAPFNVLSDTLGFVIDECSPAVLASVSTDVDWQVEKMRLLPRERSERMQRHLLNLDMIQPGRDLVIAAGTAEALKDGLFTPDAPRPWDSLEYVDPSASSAAWTRSAAFGAGSVPLSTIPGMQAHSKLSRAVEPSRGVLPGARSGWPTKLANSGSVSLSLFGAQVTRDAVPVFRTSSPGQTLEVASTTFDGINGQTFGTAAVSTKGENDDPDGITPPVHLESEKSYGEYLGGEPIFARDLRRGLVPFSGPALADQGGAAGTPITIDLTGDEDQVADLSGLRRRKRKNSRIGGSESSGSASPRGDLTASAGSGGAAKRGRKRKDTILGR